MNMPKSRFLLYFPLVIIRENWYNSKASYRCYRLLRRKAIPGIDYNIIRGRKLKKIQEDIKTGNFRQAYLLYGEETYLKQQYKQNLAKALNPDGDTMNFSHYEGKGIDVKQLIDLCETMPFFADHRVILLEDTGFFKNKCDELADYMKELPEYLCLIFAESEVDKRSRMYKAVKSCGMIEEFARQDEKTLMRWAAGILGKAGRKITQRDMELLLTKTGTDMGNLRMELEKLISYTEGKDIVTAEDIEEICTTQTTNRIFDMRPRSNRKKSETCSGPLLRPSDPERTTNENSLSSGETVPSAPAGETVRSSRTCTDRNRFQTRCPRIRRAKHLYLRQSLHSL